jgi:hypothetical protein
MNATSKAPAAASGTMTLTNDRTGQAHDLQVLEGSLGPPAFDIQNLYRSTGHFTFDRPEGTHEIHSLRELFLEPGDGEPRP